MSFSHAEEHVIYQILNAPMREYPYQHVFVENVFPDDYYQNMQMNLPPISGYEAIGKTGTVSKDTYSSRYITDIHDLEKRGVPAHQVAFWTDLEKWMMSERFMRTIIYKFSAAYRERFKDSAQTHYKLFPELRLIRDFESYVIGPHTDTDKKVVSLLFYLPKDWEYNTLGTSVYIPNDPNFTCLGGPHHPFEGFRKVFTAPFVPNSLLMFFKTPRSFHGVERILEKEVERNLLLYNIFCNPVPERV